MIMMNMSSGTRFLASYYHTPSDMAQKVFITALRAGHLKAAPDYRIDRRTCAGHDLLYCVKGRGFVQACGRSHQVEAGRLAWLNGRHPHAHWAEPAQPWELLWARIDGAALEQIYEDLDIGEWPVFQPDDPRKVGRTFHVLLRTMRDRPPAMEALLNAEASRLLAFLYVTRQGRRGREPGGDGKLPDPLRMIIDDLNVYFYRPWKVQELAEIAGMSVPNFFRCFRRATGTTPIGFLRRVRINQAKRRLIESTDSIKEVAEQVGYSDQFYFSRDFKRSTGVAPSDFRRHEMGEPPPTGVFTA